MTSGPWALFRLIDRGRPVGTASASRMVVDFTFDDRHAALELVTGEGTRMRCPASFSEGFSCPRARSAGRADDGNTLVIAIGKRWLLNS